MNPAVRSGNERRRMVVCSGSKITKTIQKLAEERDCVLISTPYDTYTAARLINQSMPIKFFMRRDHLITFETGRLY